MPLTQLLARQGFVVLDGGLATELEAKGADIKDPLWSAKLLLESPDLIEQVNYEFLCAGADVAATASYQATIPGLMSKGLTAPQAEAVIRKSVDITRHARDRFWSENHSADRLKPLVAASIGPYGAYLHDGSEYRGNYGLTVNQLKDFHRARLAILVESKPDIIAFESFPSDLEAIAVIELMSEFPNAACWISFTCKDEEHICEGALFADAVKAICRSPQVEAVGINCNHPNLVLPLLQSARNVTAKPFAAYPNDGACFDARLGTWSKTSEERPIHAYVADWFNAGARVIGGCCLTTPDMIRNIRNVLSSLPLAV